MGFAIQKDIVTKLTEMPRPVSDRIMTMSKGNFATIIGVYAPIMTNPDENKEAFYNQLASVLSVNPRTDKPLLIGDFNAKIGKDNDKWPVVMGKHGIGKYNSNGELLLAALQQVVYNTAETYIGKPERKYQVWFDLNDHEQQTLMSRKTHQRVLQTRSTRSTTATYKDTCRLLQKLTRALESDWWERKAV